MKGESAALSGGDSAAPGRVEHDLPCATCGYNLRGLFVGDSCPECNLAVSSSLSGRLLRFADPHFFASVTNGLRFISVGRAWLLSSIAILLLFILIALFVLPMVSLPVMFERAVTIGIAIMVALSACFVACGTWLMLSPEGEGDVPDPLVHEIVRVACAATPLALAAWILSPALRLVWGFSATWMHVLVSHVSLALLMLFISHCAGAMAQLRSRCAGITEIEIQGVRRSLRIARYLPLVFVILYWLGPVRNSMGRGGWAMPDGTSNGLLLIGAILLWLAILQMYNVTRRYVAAEGSAIAGDRVRAVGS